MSPPRRVSILSLLILAPHWTLRAQTTNNQPQPGDVRVNPKDGLRYAWIPPGKFRMGCSEGGGECFDNEKPARDVTLTKGFWMGQTEVTVEAYKKFASATGSGMPEEAKLNTGWTNGSMPIVNVDWNGAKNYCERAGGHLPSEAEWEYAASAGSTGSHYAPVDEAGWYDKNRSRDTPSKYPRALALP